MSFNNSNTPTKWTEEEKEIVIDLKQNYSSITFGQIAEELVSNGFEERTAKSIQGIWRRYKESGGEVAPKKKVIPDSLFIDAKEEYNETVEHTETLKEMDRMVKTALREMNTWESNIGNPTNNADIKVVSYSDQHIPFYHRGVLEHLIENNSDADILILNGDFLEVYSVSSWAKNKSIMLRHEYELGMRMLKKLAEIFPKIILTRGNHEDRLQRYFSSNIDPSVSFMTDPDILYRMSEGYDFDKYGDLTKKYKLDNVHYNKGPLAWYVQVGKCIFAHPSGGSSIPMRTAIKTAGYFVDRGIDFEAMSVGHTHQMGKIIWNKKLLIEQGCSCIPLEYEATSKMSYRPQSFGYSVVWMDKDGHVDFNKSDFVYFGTGSIVQPNGKFDLE